VVTLQEGTAKITVLLGSSGVQGSTVYVFDEDGAYLDINSVTDDQGLVTFQLPEGTYRFRADFQSNQYWETRQVTAHQVTEIPLDTRCGAYLLTVLKGLDDPLVNVPVYVFSDAGSYLGMTGSTNDQGKVSFELAEGGYKFRVDYMGYQFWTDVSTVHEILSDELTIAHTDLTISVNSEYGTQIDPVAGVNVYLFTSGGFYQGTSATTDSHGQVMFRLPDEAYMVRADYLGGRYWSDVIDPPENASVRVDIAHGTADIHVTESGADVDGANVYLFTENGSYLGRYETTQA